MHKICDKGTIIESSSSSSSADASVVVANSPGLSLQLRSLRRRLRCRRWFRGPVSERLLTFGFLTLYLFWWQFALVTVGNASIPYLVWNDTVENSWGVNCIYPREFTRSIQPFGSNPVYVVCYIDETGNRALKISCKWNTTYIWVVEFVFFLVTVCTCDCWVR